MPQKVPSQKKVPSRWEALFIRLSSPLVGTGDFYSILMKNINKKGIETGRGPRLWPWRTISAGMKKCPHLPTSPPHPVSGARRKAAQPLPDHLFDASAGATCPASSRAAIMDYRSALVTYNMSRHIKRIAAPRETAASARALPRPWQYRLNT